MQRIRVLLHSRLGWRRLTTGTYVIGRDDECDIIVLNNRTSRRHARLVVTESGAWIEDLKSVNGTYINGVVTKGRQQLQHQDFIGIGARALEVVLEPDLGASPMEILRPKSTIPPPSEEPSEVTIGLNRDESSQHAVEIWAEGVIAAARANRLTDPRTRRSAMRFGIERATDPPAARWVDFVVELASLGVPLAVDQALVLSAAIEQVGVEAKYVDTFVERLRALPPSGDQQTLCILVDGWQPHTRRGWY